MFGNAEHPATDLGYLLHKHPDRVQSFSLSTGTATVFFPEATSQRCTCALILEIDQQKLAKQARQGIGDFALAQYVNDRSYAAGSMLGAALGRVFSTARSGRCEARQALADVAVPLEISVPVLPVRGGVADVQRVFEPLGWQVLAEPIALDARFPQWGDSPYVHLTLRGNVRLADALNQLRVLLPVLDESKHYWQSDDEVEKLLSAGEGWLENHPDREFIARKYLARSRDLVNDALVRLAESDLGSTGYFVRSDDSPTPPPRPSSSPTTPHGSEDGSLYPTDSQEESAGTPNTSAHKTPDSATNENRASSATDSDIATSAPKSNIPCSAGEFSVMDATVPLKVYRHNAVLEVLHDLGAKSVIDLGCGPGDFLVQLAKDHTFTKITGVDVSARALQTAARRLHFDELSERQAERLTLFQGALTYSDNRFAGYDAAVLVEVIEHIDPPRLPALERVVFAEAKPKAVIVTTPNQEYNAQYPGLMDGGHRHHDHRFEWTRAEFEQWADQVATEHGHTVRFTEVGLGDPTVGSPSQMGVFSRD